VAHNGIVIACDLGTALNKSCAPKFIGSDFTRELSLEISRIIEETGVSPIAGVYAAKSLKPLANPPRRFVIRQQRLLFLPAYGYWILISWSCSTALTYSFFSSVVTESAGNWTLRCGIPRQPL
jgi:hypothetical protein